MTGWEAFEAYLERNNINGHYGIAFKNWLAEEFDVPRLAVPWPEKEAV